jgi:hypothetical protein
VAVLDLPNPNDPANVVDGIIGMHLFNGRNLVIDANPAASQGGGGPPRLYISDPVTETHSWANTAATGDWATPSNWSPPGAPSILWDTQVRNVSGVDQVAIVSTNSTVNRLTVGGGAGGAQMTVAITATLTTFGETLIEAGGEITLHQPSELPGARLDAQFVNIDGGVLSGEGEIFVGTGPINGVVRNISGRVAPSTSAPSIVPVGHLEIVGDFANLAEGTVAIDISGTLPHQYDRLTSSRFAFLDGTLEVSLVDLGSLSYVPNVGDMFTILTAGEGIEGTFDNLQLPAGFTWNVLYGANNVTLSVTGLGLAGDFNGDGSVNTADYIVWRKSGGNLPDYNDWRTNFGRTSSGAGSSTSVTGAVPEPSGVVLSVCGLVAAVALRKLGRPLAVSLGPNGKR